jgi:hypothetical protein
MLRIIIEIDGKEVAATTIQPAALNPTFPQVSGASTSASNLQAPSELLAIATALGATSAGPAPGGVVVQPLGQSSTSAGAELGMTDAGSAPTG